MNSWGVWLVTVNGIQGGLTRLFFRPTRRWPSSSLNSDSSQQLIMRLHLRARCSSFRSLLWPWRIASLLPRRAGTVTRARSIEAIISDFSL
jgi:hypothetical protein